jgi:outer membrane protein OmpA-like peptidoglycan-associated protein
MSRITTDLKIGFIGLSITVLAAFVVIFVWYQDHSLSVQYIGEAQKLSSALPILAVTEGRVSQLTSEMRKNESFKGELDAHLTEQINKIRLGEYTADQLNTHIQSCKKFCGLLLGEIFNANMREIANLPHELVFFNLDEDQVTPKYRQRLLSFGKKYNNQNLYLIGRASFIGGPGYNKELSERRVKQVELWLKKQGFSEWQLKPTWLGYEAPQLSREIADSYKIDPLDYKSDLFNLNQSVVLFVSPPEQYFPGVLDTMTKEVGKRESATVTTERAAPPPTRNTVLPPAGVQR